jgi:hypothetical protein
MSPRSHQPSILCNKVRGLALSLESGLWIGGGMDSGGGRGGISRTGCGTPS